MAGSPSISVCMIVKDEAANLRACLESLGDLPQEIIVVDTGSTDDTAAIAREMGARVYPFTWIDDFAAARNESLRHATREWIFWLDADNRLTPESVAQLKLVAGSGRADAYGCLVDSRLADGSSSVTEYILLFRNGLGVEFTGAIHESVVPALAERRLRLAHTAIPVQHVGYETPEMSRRKSRRNLAIVERELERHPDDLDLLFYRGQSRFHLDQPDGWQADLENYLSRTTPQQTFHWKRFMAHTMLVVAGERRRDPQGMESLLLRALEEFPNHPNFLAVLGRLHLALGRPEKALGELQAAVVALSRPHRGSIPPRGAVECSLDQARALLSRGDPSKAVGSLADAIRLAPSEPANYRHLAVALQRLGQEEEALRVFSYATQLEPPRRQESGA